MKKNKEKSKLNKLKNKKIKINYLKNNNKIKKILKNKINKKNIKKKYKININKNKILKNNKLKINEKYKNKKNNYIKKEIINNLKNILIKKTKNKLIFFLNINLILKNKKFNEIKNNKEKINIIFQLIKNAQKNFEYIILKLDEIPSYMFKEEIIEKDNKIILIGNGNYLGAKRIYELLYNGIYNEKQHKRSLHIYIKKEKNPNINIRIIKKIFKNYKIKHYKIE